MDDQLDDDARTTQHNEEVPFLNVQGPDDLGSLSSGNEKDVRDDLSKQQRQQHLNSLSAENLRRHAETISSEQGVCDDSLGPRASVSDNDEENSILMDVRMALERSSASPQALRANEYLSRRGSAVFPLGASVNNLGSSVLSPGFSSTARELRFAAYRYEGYDAVYPRNSPHIISLSSLVSALPASQPKAAMNRRVSLQQRAPHRSANSKPVVVTPTEMSTYQKYSHLNSLDESQRSETLDIWWRDQRHTREVAYRLCPRPHDPAQEVPFPAHGFYKSNTDTSYTWNERYLQLLCGPRGVVDEETHVYPRDVAVSQFVRDFCDEAVPIAVYALANVAHLPAHVVNCHGITVEVCAVSPTAAILFDRNPRQANMVASREYRAREMAQYANVAGLVVPFTILVEAHGCKALVYPQAPVNPPTDRELDAYLDYVAKMTVSEGAGRRAPKDKEGGAPRPGDVCYGSPDGLSQFHTAFGFVADDPEVEGLVAKLCGIVKSKGHWLGNTLDSSISINGPADLQVLRSSLDNRLYLQHLLHLLPSTIPITVEPEPEAPPASPEATNDNLNASQRRSSGFPTGAFSRPTDNAAVSPFTDQNTCNDYYVNLFRPEFVLQHMDTELTFDSAHHLSVLGRGADESDRGAMLNKLFSFVIPQAVSQFSRDIRLRGVGWNEMEKGGLSIFMHRQGINMRFLPAFRAVLLKRRAGQGAAATQVPNKEALQYVEIEMAARALKVYARASPSYEKGHGITTMELAQRVKAISTAKPADLWEDELFPLIQSKYPSLGTEKWSAIRLPWRKVVGRMLVMLGATIRSGLRRKAPSTDGAVVPDLASTIRSSDGEGDSADEAEPDNTLPYLPDALGTIRIVFTPKVQVPPFPDTQFGDGQEIACCLRAQRYLRHSSRVAVEAVNRPMVALYTHFLTEHGLGECEAVMEMRGLGAQRNRALLSMGGGADEEGAEALSLRPVKDIAKGRLEEALTAARSAKADPTHARYRKHDGTAVSLDTSEAALRCFGVEVGQRVQISLGMDKGVFTTIVGVSEEKLFRMDDGHTTVDEFVGPSREHLISNYGLHPCHPQSSPMPDLSTLSATDPLPQPPVVEGAVLPLKEGLMVVEVADAVVEHHFAGMRVGDIVQMRPDSTKNSDPNTPVSHQHACGLSSATSLLPGSVARVVGMLPGRLFVHPLESIGFPVAVRTAESKSLQVLDRYEAVDEDTLFTTSTRETTISGAPRKPHFADNPSGPYPVETAVLIDPCDQGAYAVGLKATVRFGYHYRYVVRFGAGPHAGMLAAIVGTSKGCLYCKLLGDLDAPCIPLADVKELIEELHCPEVVGLLPSGLSEIGRTSTPQSHIHRISATGTANQALVSATSCPYVSYSNWRARMVASKPMQVIPPVLFTGGRLCMLSGPRCGEVATIAGFDSEDAGYLWVRFEGDLGLVHLSSIDPGHFHVLSDSKYTSRAVTASITDGDSSQLFVPCFTFMGLVVGMDASVGACLPFGYFHGQLLEVVLWSDPNGPAMMPISIRVDASSSYSATVEEEVPMLPTKERVVVVGVYASRLWVQQESRAYAVPLDGSHFFEVCPRYDCPPLVGLANWAPWSDMFVDPPAKPRASKVRLPTPIGCTALLDHYSALVLPSAFDRNYSVEHVRLFVDAASKGPIGLFIDGDATSVLSMKVGTSLQRVKRTNFQASHDAGTHSVPIGADVFPKGRKRSLIRDSPATSRMSNIGRLLVARGSSLVARANPTLLSSSRRMTVAEEVRSESIVAAKLTDIPISTINTVVVGVLSDGTVYVADSTKTSRTEGILVYPLPPGEWEPTPIQASPTGVQDPTQLFLTFTTVRIPDASYLCQLGLQPPRNGTIVASTYCLRKCDAADGDPPVCTIPDSVKARMEKQCMIGTIYEMGGVLNLDALTFTPDHGGGTSVAEKIGMDAMTLGLEDETVYRVVEEPIHSLESFLEVNFHIRPSWAARVIDTIDCIAEDAIFKTFGRSATWVTTSGEDPRRVKGFYTSDLQYLRAGLADSVPELLLLDALESADTIPDEKVDAYRQRYFKLIGASSMIRVGPHSKVVTSIHKRAAYAGALLGLSEDVLLGRCSEGEVIRVVMVLEGRVFGGSSSCAVVGDSEYAAHLLHACSTIQSEEAYLRAEIHHLWMVDCARFMQWGHVEEMPFESARERAAKSVQDEIHRSFASHPMMTKRVSTTKSRSPPQAGSFPDPSAKYRFIRGDATVVFLAASDPAFQWRRGDEVRYTVGDVLSVRAIILGVHDGALWRWEYDGPTPHCGQPFIGTSDIIKHNYQPVVTGHMDPSSGDIPGGNPIPFLTWSGELVEFDSSYDACVGRFGLSAGQRLQSTSDTPQTFPYRDSVLVVVGAKDGCLWFALDMCGAMPFPIGIRDPARHFRLHPLYHAPIQPPIFDSSKLSKLRGTLAAAETNFLSAVGTPSLLFNTTRAAITAFSGGKLQHGRKVRVAGALLGGATKSTRAVIIGIRHGKLWAMQDYDVLAAHLTLTPTDIASMDFPPFQGEEPHTTVISLPLPTLPSRTDAPLTFTLPTGGLGLFRHGSDVYSLYGVVAGDVLEWGGGGSKRRSIVVGMRGDQLWRIDEGEAFARPFIGITEREGLRALQYTTVGTFSGVRSGTLPW